MHTTKCLMWAAVLIFLVSLSAVGQEKAVESAPKPLLATYRMQYTVSEIADGKRVNSRSYETLVEEPTGNNANWSQIRMGNRVPLASEKGPSYFDIGLSIDAGIRKQGEQIHANTRFDLSSIAPEQQGAQGGAPVVRSIRFTADNNLALGQKVLLSAGDDVNSNHRFEVELVVTKMK